MLRVAVVGLGGIGKNHTRCYSENPDAQLVAICDTDSERVDPVAKQYGLTPYYSVEDLLASEDFDAVSVATAGPENGGHHFAPTMALLSEGKHVLVEKPISNDLTQARRMVAEAERRGVSFGVNLNHRFTPAAERAKALQQDSELGDVLFVNMGLWINNPNESSRWFHMRALHPHSIDVMRYFGGPISAVQAFMHAAPGRENWSNVSLNVRFASGAVGHLSGSYDASPHHPIERCEVAGTAGRFVIHNVFERLEFFPRNKPDKLVVDNPIMGGMQGFSQTFTNRINRFVQQVSDGSPLDASGADGLAAQEVIEAAIRSFENGTVEEVAG